MDSTLTASVTVNAGNGDDIVDAATYPTSLTINGEDGADLLGGGLGDDTVNGGDGNDLFIVDSSIFITSAGVNPVSTMQALALYIADAMKKILKVY